MRTVNYKAGDTIVSEGDVGDSAYRINAGTVEVTVGNGQNARSVAKLEAGEIFGEMSLIDAGPRSATVKALTDTECVVTTYDELARSFHQHPEQAFEFMETLVHRLRLMNALVQDAGPGKRRLRDIFNDWQETFEDSQAAARNAEKRFYIV
jgi:CRP-like cAMP-binding protein